MIKNHFKIAWRNLFKNAFYTLLNVIGLVMGISFVLMISIFIWQEYRVNADLKHLNRQYVIQSKYKNPGEGIEIATIGALAKTLKEEYPHLVSDYYRFDGISCIASKGDQVFQEDVALGDSTILTAYGFELLDGDVHTALSEPFSVVLTEDVALKYFGRINAVGETLTIQNFEGEKRDFAVTGVLKRPKRNSVLNLTSTMVNTLFMSVRNASYFGRDLDSWYNPYIASYITLREGVQPDQLVQPMKSLLEKHADERIVTNLTPVLKPLRTYYLDDNNGAVQKTMVVLSAVAGLLLLMVVINFVNISVSKSMGRLREIGVRKIMGSTRLQLTIQLLTESLLTVFFSASVALLIYPLLSPVFSRILGQALPSLSDLPSGFYGYYIVGIVLLGVLAGIYPALRLSTSKTLIAVKGQLTGVGEKHLIRKSLLATQFVIAMIVLIGAVVIHRQLAVLFGKELGFDTDFLITAQVPRDWSPEGLVRIKTIQQEIRSLPQVEQASLSYDIPGMNGNTERQVSRLGTQEHKSLSLIMADAYYADAFKIGLLAGSFFAEVKEAAADPQKVVLSRKAVEDLDFGSAEEAVGQQISMNDGRVVLTIAGVTDDLYFKGMHGSPSAAMWLNVAASNQYRFLNIRIRPGDIVTSLDALANKWKSLMPDAPFEYLFMDEQLRNIYDSEVRLQRASSMATVLCVIVVILGIVGLVSLAVQQRMKEIGIRKVLGASLVSIIRLFVKDFIWVYVIALGFAVPVAYFVLSRWLDNFYLKVNLNIGIFMLPIGLLLFLLLFCVGLQSMRAARTNPVDSLRDE